MRTTFHASRFTFHVSRFTFHVSRHYPLFILISLILLFFHKMAFSNLILARGDTFLYFYPYWEAAAEALRNGRVPHWNPHLFMGAPFLANSQVGFFYPLNWPLWLLLPTPYAVSASILLHLLIAGWGVYLAGRRALTLDRAAALAAATLFALGGYLTAQVEHVNQLQGLAWLPWFFAVLGSGQWSMVNGQWSMVNGRRVAAIGALFALQLLAGHTQTAFITGVAVVIWVLVSSFGFQVSGFGFQVSGFRFQVLRNTQYVIRLIPLLLGVILALFLAAVQLLPTLELAQHSSRQGGLPVHEVLSFSLHPLLLPRSLLPAYGQSLFSEYVAVLPVTALLLSFVGAWQWRRWPGVLPALALVMVGLLLALGAYNPLNWLLGQLPGFNLFRAPARWLALYALGVALLAGFGWQIIVDRWRGRAQGVRLPPGRQWTFARHLERPLYLGIVALLLLAAWSGLATFLAIYLPTGPEAPYEPPAPLTAVSWGIELLLVYLAISGRTLSWNRRARFKRQLSARPLISPLALALAALLSLFFASRTHPYNNLTTPEAYFDLRPPVSRLQALASSSLHVFTSSPLRPFTPTSAPPDRFLALSDIFFDPGDQAEIEAIYADQLPPDALYDYVIAVKQKEIMAPNLPLVYGLSAVDGFDGGVLPLNSYSQLMQLILPPGEETVDGRLREYLTAVPEAKWLDLFNVRYFITDKTGDVWREGVFFDLQHPVTIAAGEMVSIGYVPGFTATELWLIADDQPGPIMVATTGNQTWQITAEPLAEDLYRAAFSQAAQLHSITLSPCHSVASLPCRINGVSLVNSRNDTFYPLVPGPYRMIHSGDVKIYQNLAVLPRAYLVHEWQWQPDVSSSVAAMRAAEFDPRQTAVLIGKGEESEKVEGRRQEEEERGEPGEALFVSYEPEQIVIRVQSEQGGLLILTDAYYPGWQATVDGAPTPIYQANGLFRGVMISAGANEVTFTYESRYFHAGWRLSLVGLVLVLGLMAHSVVKKVKENER